MKIIGTHAGCVMCRFQTNEMNIYKSDWLSGYNMYYSYVRLWVQSFRS